MMTKRGDVNIYSYGSLKNGFTLFRLNLDVVDEELDSFWDRLSLPRMGYRLRFTC